MGEKKKSQQKNHHLTYTGANVRITSAISECMQPRRKWNEVVLSKNNHQPITYPVKLLFKRKEEIKTFSNKKPLRKFVANKRTLQKKKKNV